MKLSYNAVDTFSSVDIGDYGADPPFEFEMPTMRPDDWTTAYVAFRESGNVDLACDVLAIGLISIGQGDERWPIDSVDDVKALMAAIEASNPGRGEQFIVSLADRIAFRRFSQEADRLGNLERSSMPSTNGTEDQEEKLAA